MCEDEKFIFIKIKNTGFNISDNIKEHIFEKYVSKASLNNNTGSGLGLYYCKTVIEAHKGKISLNTEPNTNEFIIQLPKNHDITDDSFSFT
jgi:two-component system phosphate regulon sensor histidine kinase PhoR